MADIYGGGCGWEILTVLLLSLIFGTMMILLHGSRDIVTKKARRGPVQHLWKDVCQHQLARSARKGRPQQQ
jgi:hypothetical protein